jgi:hypothetical protein
MAHVDPPLVVARIRPSADPAKHVVGLGQLIAFSGTPSGTGFCQFQLPPAVVAYGLKGFDWVPAGLGIVRDGAGSATALAKTELDAGCGSSFRFVAAMPCNGKAAARKTPTIGPRARRSFLPPTPRPIVSISWRMSIDQLSRSAG